MGRTRVPPDEHVARTVDRDAVARIRASSADVPGGDQDAGGSDPRDERVGLAAVVRQIGPHLHREGRLRRRRVSAHVEVAVGDGRGVPRIVEPVATDVSEVVDRRAVGGDLSDECVSIAVVREVGTDLHREGALVRCRGPGDVDGAVRVDPDAASVLVLDAADVAGPVQVGSVRGDLRYEHIPVAAVGVAQPADRREIR